MTPDAGIVEALRSVLDEASRIGMVGAAEADDVIQHALAFVRALEGVTGSVVDLGSGGGVPGLVIAAWRPDLRLTLVDRRTKRTDFLQRMVRRLAMADRVTVLAGDVAELVGTDLQPAMADAVTSRGFGPPAAVLRWGALLARPGAPIVVSEPPASRRRDPARWPPALLSEHGVTRIPGPDGVVVFAAAGQTA